MFINPHIKSNRFENKYGNLARISMNQGCIPFVEGLLLDLDVYVNIFKLYKLVNI